MNDLFVSWAGKHAKDIGEHIRSLFAGNRDRFNVFLSTRDIRLGRQWQDDLLENLHNAAYGVVIFSQEAIKSDWLIHESAILSSRTELTIFLLGAPAEMLPQPLRRFQYAPFSRDSLESWINGLIKDNSLNISLARRDAFLDEVGVIISDYEATHVSADDRKWAGTMARPLAISQQLESPYELNGADAYCAP